ncbi:hypothetical protein B0H10DRAFT_2201018 [Mycena sp. CBHHK59/15]|nr:hypothetical protein B0H10DRAFT_2201018 [Mycena sp. CBHHK59/15]
MLSLSSPIGFPDLYPVPAINSSESSEILLTHVDGLGRDLNFMQGEIRGLHSMLEIVLEATRNPTNEAPWIRLASEAFRGQTFILAKSPQLAQLKQQYPLVRFWTPADFDTDSDSAPRTKIKKSAGGTDKKNDVNNEGQYVEHADGTVVGGIEFGQVRECANHLFFDLLAAGRATRKLAHIGEHVRGALIYMLELRYPHLGLCVEHWKVLRIVQDRYRFWAAPFRNRLISYDAPVPGPPPPGPSPPGAPPPPPPSASMAHKRAADDSADSERAKKRQELLNDPLLIQIPPPSDERVPPPNTEPDIGDDDLVGEGGAADLEGEGEAGARSDAMAIGTEGGSRVQCDIIFPIYILIYTVGVKGCSTEVRHDDGCLEEGLEGDTQTRIDDGYGWAWVD